jgi:hypothetical protein
MEHACRLAQNHQRVTRDPSAILIGVRNGTKLKKFVCFHNLYEDTYEKTYEIVSTKNIVRKRTKEYEKKML